MRTNRLLASSLLCVSGAVVASGCVTDMPIPVDGGANDAMNVGDAPPNDSGSSAMTSLSYMPEGCAYPVRTPTVIDAQRSSDVFGATPTFDHVHVGWAGPTDTTIAVIWRSDRETLASSVLIGMDQAAVMAANGAATGVTRHDGHTVFYSGTTSATGAERVHEVHICGLTAGTTYYYRVGGPGHWSQAFAVSTGPSVGSSAMWSFGVTGDSRGAGLADGPGDNAFAIAQHRLADRAVDFEVFTGDAVNIGASQPLWNLFFDGREGTFGVQDFLAHHPLMMSNGNHDLLEGNHGLMAGNSARIGANSDALAKNFAMLKSNGDVVVGNSDSLAANHALLEANSRLLKSNAAMMTSNHDLLLKIAAKLGL